MNKYILLLLTLCAGNAFAVANKWIDEQGKVHYSDQLPPGHVKAKAIVPMSATELPAPVSSVSSVPATAKTAAETDPAKIAAAKKAAADKATQEAALKEQNRTNCINAKQNQANLKDGMRIAIIDPISGERSYMDDTQRQKSMDDAQQQISKYCQ